ncbi:MAG: RHS repeat-associated core domain-containing protein [Acidobacteriota bacterium]
MSIRRKLMCFGLISSLLILPGPGIAASEVRALASTAVDLTTSPIRYLQPILKSLFGIGVRAKPQRETLADRRARVSRIRVSPLKLVGYVGDVTIFTASPTDFRDRTIQGVKFDWESSDPQKLQVDDAGRATFLQPGRVWINCRAGSAWAAAPVLIRPGQRQRQSDLEWKLDQAGLDGSGNITGQSSTPQSGTTASAERGADDATERAPNTSTEPTIESAASTAKGLLGRLIDNLAPTAYAQGSGYCGNDFAYDELWSEPRNLIGSPRNRAVEATALGAVLPEGSNFDLAIPIVGLGGRGLATTLSLYSNTRIWSRHGNAVTFDAIASWPSPGFSLGFGRIVAYNVGTGGNPTCKLMLIGADGTRRYLGVGYYYQSSMYQTADGTHISFFGNPNTGGTLLYNDGTSVSISAVNNRLLPTQILDSNGNYVQIAYRDVCDAGGNCIYPPMAIDFVTDTLGRKIQFTYDSSARLTKIEAPGFGGTVQNPVTRTLVQFDYQAGSLSYNFSGLTVENLPGGFARLKHVYFPATLTGYLFTYSGYGMVYNFSARRQMNINGSGVISDGLESANVTFNYPTSGSTQLTDAPAFTQRTETAVSSPSAIFTYSMTTDAVAQTKTLIVTRPDSSQVLLTRSTNVSSLANGLLTQTEFKDNIGGSIGKSILSYVNDLGGSQQMQSVTSFDDLTPTPNQTRVDFDYDQYGNVTNRREYGFQESGGWRVRRRTRLVYKTDSGYIGFFLRSLVIEANVYDALLNTNDADDAMIAKTTYAYDNYAAMGGMEDYGGSADPPGHLIGWNASVTTRGNVTGTTEWTDLTAGTTVQHLAKYDIFGNVVKAQVSCCQEKDLTNTDATYWSQTETETSGDPNGVHTTTSTDYDFNTSLPTLQTNPAGLESTIGYNAALQASSVTLPTGANASAAFNYATLSSTSQRTYDDLGTQKTITSTTQYDGWGRVIYTVAPNNAQVNVSYDSMGRVHSRTNPFQTGGSPGPATTIQYDIANRAVTTTLPDGNIARADYSGSTVTLTDPVNRKTKRENDGLGRLIKVTEQTSTGALSQETYYSYSLLDGLTLVNQGNQARGYKYDATGRLLYEKIPEQTATINDGTGTMWTSAYSYTEYGAVKKKTNARGVESHYAYDALRNVTQIWFTGVGGDDSGSVRPSLPSGVAATDDRNFAYTSWGALSSVTIPTKYTETYAFDSFFQVSSVTRWILGQTSDTRKTYTTNYEYNLGSQFSKMIYPSGQQVSVNHDDKGRTQSLTNEPGDTTGYLTALGYNIAGQVTGMTLGNGVVESYGYDANRLHLTSQTATKGATSLMNLAYNYQATAGQMGTGSTAGNAGQLMGISGTINSTTESAAYTYDLLGRLATSNQSSNGSSAQRLFEYDPWGNRTAVYDGLPGGKTPPTQIQSVTLPTTVQQGGSAPTNRIGSVTNNGSTVNYTYDSAANVTNDGLHTYTYDAENRLVSVDSGATAQYRYDHQNHRVTKIIGSSWTHYVWQGSQVISEHDATTAYSTNPTYQVASARLDNIYIAGRMFRSRQRTSSISSWTTRYFLRDSLSVRMTLDTNGTVLGRQAHLPFGEDFGETGTLEKHHFTSYERDGESATDYAVNRQYAPGLGRFMGVDPIPGSIDDPQNLNRFGYGNNDPTNRVDPLGLRWESVCTTRWLPDLIIEFSCTYSWIEDREYLPMTLNLDGILASINIDIAAIMKWAMEVGAVLEGLEAAKDALNDPGHPECMEMFTGPDRTNDPIATMDTYSNNGLIRVNSTYPGPWDPAKRAYQQMPFLNVNNGAVAQVGTGFLLSPSGTRQSAYTITINPIGPFMTGAHISGTLEATDLSNTPAFRDLSLGQIRGAMLIHEFLHVFGLRSDESDPARSNEISQEVRDKCF